MAREPHAGMTAAAERLAAFAANAVSSAEQPESFTRLVNGMLAAVKMNVRIVIDGTLKPPGTDPIALNTPRDASMEYTLALREHGSIYWDMTAKIMTEDSFAMTSFAPETQLHSPIATWIHGTRNSMIETFGESIAPSIDAVVNSFAAENDAFNALHAERAKTIKHLIENESRALSSLTPLHLMTADLSRRRDVLSLKGVARLIARNPAYEMHAHLDILNALRSHQTAMMASGANLGLRTLAMVKSPSEAEYFSLLLEEVKPNAVSLYRAMMNKFGTDEEKLLTAMRTIDDLSPFDVDNADDIAIRAKQERTAMLAYFETQLQKRTPPLSAENEDNAKAFVDASNRLENASTDARLLKDVLGAERHRAELADARKHHDSDLLGAKEQEIVAAVLRELMKFEHSHADNRDKDADPDSFTPAYVAKNKKINCFTGPWLAAAMLMECGIKESQLFYVDVEAASDGQAGIHGSLMVALSSGQQMLLDIGHRKMRTLPFGAYDTQTKRKLEKLLRLESMRGPKSRIRPVNADMNRTTAKATGIHPVMHVMPMRQGFAWGTLLTMAMTKLEKGKVADARHALELAHSMHPESSDVLCELGRCALASGDPQVASQWFSEALRCNPAHAPSLYQTALMLIDAEKYEEAFLMLRTLPRKGARWYGGKKFLDHAERLEHRLFHYCKTKDDADMLAMQKERLQENLNEV